MKNRLLFSIVMFGIALMSFGQTSKKVPLVNYYRFNSTEVKGDEIVKYVGKDHMVYTKMNDANMIEGNYTMCIKDNIYGIAPTSDAFGEDGDTTFYVQGPTSFYIDMVTGEERYVWVDSGEYFDIHTERGDIKWEITSETMEIAGLSCRKAIGTLKGGSIATVWYSEDIAIPYGPNRIWGTPGLVVTLQLGAFNYVLTNVEYTEKISEIKYVPRGKSITYEEYKKYVRERDSKYVEPIKEGDSTRQIIYKDQAVNDSEKR